MMNNVRAAGSLKQAKANGYTRMFYRKSLINYYNNPTPENLKAVGAARMERENSGQIKGGHSNYKAQDYSVKDFKTRKEALEVVAFLNKQGYKAVLENWPSSGRGENAHIHSEDQTPVRQGFDKQGKKTN
jgi:hypothetical protein